MMTGLQVFGIGRLTADAFYSDRGSATFWLATNRKYTRKGDGVVVEKRSFFWCTAFGKTAELCRNLKKAEEVCVTGDLDIEKWTDKKTGQEKPVACVVIGRIVFLSDKPKPTSEPSSDVPGDYDFNP